MGWRLGYEIGGTKTLAVVANTDTSFTIDDTIIASEPTIIGEGKADEFIDQLIRVGEAALKKAGISKGDLEGVGIGSPGPMDVELGILKDPANFGGMGDFQVITPLQDYFGFDNVNLGNDVGTAILGEMDYGFGRSRRDPSFMLITIGTGVGGGHIDHGKLKTGFRGNADEIGHMPVEYDPQKVRSDGCTKKNPEAVGHLEAYCSMYHFANWVREGINKQDAQESTIVQCAAERLNVTIDKAYDRFEAHDVFAAYMKKDKTAAKYVNDWREYFIRGLVTYVSINDPEVILLMGSGPLKNEDLMLHNLQPDGSTEMHWTGKRLAERLHTPGYFQPGNLRLTELGDKVGLYGAIALAAPKKK